MRFGWVASIVMVALLAVSCSSGTGSSTGATTPKHHRHHHKTTTTTTTGGSGAASTTTTIAAGAADVVACNTFHSFVAKGHESHKAASEDLRRLFREFKKSENKDLRAEGHRAAKALLSNDAKVFKKDFFAIYLACNRLGAG